MKNILLLHIGEKSATFAIANLLKSNRYLKSHNYRVIESTEVDDVLEKSQSISIHIIIIDLVMETFPQIYQVTSITRQLKHNLHTQTIPILVCGADDLYTLPTQLHLLMTQGVDCPFIWHHQKEKSYNERNLIGTIKHILRNEWSD